MSIQVTVCGAIDELGKRHSVWTRRVARYPRTAPVGGPAYSGSMAFATEHPVVAHSEYRAVDDVVRTGGSSRWSVNTSRPAISPRPSKSSNAGSGRGRRTSSFSAPPVPASPRPPHGSSSGCSGPTLVMAPNKTLAAQLANELREMLPHNAVEYFVSYYDYYQPEAYIAQTDTYIEKDSSINDDVERLAALGHVQPVVPARRRRGRIRVVHLRSGHPAVLPGPVGGAQRRRRRAP